MEKLNLWLRKNSWCFLLGFLISFCYPADPEYREKVLHNYDYSGFISREFFQVVVEVEPSLRELTIAEERKDCKERATFLRNDLTLKILRQEASEFNPNSDRYEEDSEEKPEDEILASFEASHPLWRKPSSKIIHSFNSGSLSMGEYAWFLDKMFLFREDYSDPKKCIFIYRNIQPGLYEKVVKTKLASPNKAKLVVPPTKKTN